MIGYLLEAWHDQDDALPYRVIDSRGKGRLIWSPIFLARGLVTALMEILLGRVALMHVNMAESMMIKTRPDFDDFLIGTVGVHVVLRAE